MVDSDLVAVGGEVSAWVADRFVVPEAGGEGEQALSHAGGDAAEGACSVALQGELSLSVWKTDSIHWRVPPSEPKRGGSSVKSCGVV